MGTSIAACPLARNQRVVAIESDIAKRRAACRRGSALLRGMSQDGLLGRTPEKRAGALSHFGLYVNLAECDIG